MRGFSTGGSALKGVRDEKWSAYYAAFVLERLENLDIAPLVFRWPLWVISGHGRVRQGCPLYPWKPTCIAVTSTQLVAIRVGARAAGNVIARTALHKVRFVRMPEENERRPVVERARVAGNLPSRFQQILDGNALIDWC